MADSAMDPNGSASFTPSGPANSEHLWRLTRNLLDLQKSGKFCDLQLLCQDGSLTAHSVVLASACDTLQATIQHQHMHLPMMDYSLETVQRMVTYLYTGHIDPPPPHEEISFQNLMDSMGLPHTQPDDIGDFMSSSVYPVTSPTRIDQDIKPHLVAGQAIPSGSRSKKMPKHLAPVVSLVQLNLDTFEDDDEDDDDDYGDNDGQEGEMGEIDIKQEIVSDDDEPSTPPEAHTPNFDGFRSSNRGRKRKVTYDEDYDYDDHQDDYEEDYSPQIPKVSQKRKSTPKRAMPAKARKSMKSSNNTIVRKTEVEDPNSSEQFDESQSFAEGDSSLMEGMEDQKPQIPKPKKNARRRTHGTPRESAWDESRMEEALRMVNEGTSVRHISRVLGIPRGSIRHRMRNGPPHEKSSRFFTAEEEQLLLSYLHFMDRAGVKIDSKLAMTVGGFVARKCGIVYNTKDGKPTPSWWIRLRQRYPEVNALVASETPRVQGAGEEANTESVKEATDKRSLEIVSKFLKEMENNNDQDAYYNMVTVPCMISAEGVLVEISAPYCVKHSVSGIMLFTVCTCANGMVLPSLITSGRKTIEIEESLSVETEWGDIDVMTFLQYLKHLDAVITDKRPVSIFMSLFDELIDSEVVEFCLGRQIALLNVSVPNIIQPSDIIPRILQAELKSIPNVTVPQLAERFVSATMKARGEPVKAAFRQTGIFPFDTAALRSGTSEHHKPNAQGVKDCCVVEKKALTLQKRVSTFKEHGKKKRWAEDYMDQAVDLVVKEGVPLRTSARIMGIPRWSLRNRITFGKPTGKHPRLLSAQEEKSIVNQLLFMSLAGIKVTPALALNMAAQIADKHGKCLERGKAGKGRGWLYRFKLRYKELTEWGILDAGKGAKDALDEVINEHDREAGKFLKKVENLFRKHGANLDRIYNVDSVLSISDEVSNNASECVTATLCICANGTYLPPMLTFASSLPPGGEAEWNGPDNALFNTSISGQLDEVLLNEYMKHLEPMMSADKPVFVFCADKADFVTDPLMEFCLEKGIWLLNIPKSVVPSFVQPFDSIVPSLISTIELRATAETSVRVDRFKVPWLLKCALTDLQGEQIKQAFKDTGFLAIDNMNSAESDVIEEPFEFLSAKCAICKVRIGISGVHCILCNNLYHEACAGMQKGETTAICKRCMNA